MFTSKGYSLQSSCFRKKSLVFYLFGIYEDSQTQQYSLSIWRNLEESKEEIKKEKIKNNGDSQKRFFKKFLDELKKVLTIGDNFMR